MDFGLIWFAPWDTVESLSTRVSEMDFLALLFQYS